MGPPPPELFEMMARRDGMDFPRGSRSPSRSGSSGRSRSRSRSSSYDDRNKGRRREKRVRRHSRYIVTLLFLYWSCDHLFSVGRGLTRTIETGIEIDTHAVAVVIAPTTTAQRGTTEIGRGRGTETGRERGSVREKKRGREIG